MILPSTVMMLIALFASAILAFVSSEYASYAFTMAIGFATATLIYRVVHGTWTI